MPATPTIEVADNANGTGATATITGSTAGSTNTAEVQLSDRNTWVTTSDSRTGDGTLQIGVGSNGLNLTHGWKVRIKSSLSGSDAYSSTVVVVPTIGLDSPHHYAIAAAQKALIEANITGIGGRVYRCQDPVSICESHVEKYPCILLFPPANEGEQRNSADQARTTWGYPITVAIADREFDGFSQLETNLYQRMKMLDVFDRKKLEFPTTAKYRGRKVVVTPGPVVVAGAEDAKYQYHLSTVKLTVEVDRYIGGGESRP